MNRTDSLYRRARTIIPGGTQLLSKRPEMMAPEVWPPYYRQAAGCRVTDLDGNEYIDFTTNGIGSCLLGYAHPEINEAAARALRDGAMASLNPPEEVELAEMLLELHPWAGGVRFGRCGGESTAIAVRIARAHTRRDRIAICGYHGWSDWYIAANLGDPDNLKGMHLAGLDADGVPSQLAGTTLPFNYGDLEQFEALLERHGDQLACVVMEPVRHHAPPPGFLEHIRRRTRERGIVLIYDEITIGFRLVHGGSHLRLGVTPDIAVFAKALGNGHPIGAVVGDATVMAAAQRSFISSTYWTERIGPAAAVATLKALRKYDVAARVNAYGMKFFAELQARAAAAGVEIKIGSEYGCLAAFSFTGPQANAVRTLFSTLMLKEGFLAGCGFYPTLAHGDAELAACAAALDRVLPQLADAIAAGDVETRLAGPPAHTGFQRLN